MTKDRSVIDVLAAAVAAEPQNVSLRVHLATLLWDAGEAEACLEHAIVALQAEPDQLAALSLAARSAAATGDSVRAASYQRLHDALSGANRPPAPTAPLSLEPPELFDDLDDGGESPPLFSVEDDFVEYTDAAPLDQILDVNDEIWDVEQPNLKLADVGGMEKVKERLNTAFLAPLRNPELMKYYGKNLRGGLLLYGPPGCGKTFIARATAGELGAKFMPIGLPDVLDMWIGNSEKNLHEIFERARSQAPCVLFFDELDALGRKRTLVRHSGIATVINQLLAEIDSIGGNNDGVFILAATNHPWDIDTALRRPGRLDRMLLVLPPDRAARAVIMEYHLRDRPTGKMNLDRIAKETEEFSGADLAHLCESAAEIALNASIASGEMRPIEMKDLEAALKDVRPSTRAWFETARNFALFANDGGIYDDLVEYLKKARML